MNTKGTYIDKGLFKQELVKYYDTGIFTEELGLIIMQMVNGQLFSHKFINYGGYWRDEMYSTALEKCMLAINNKKFDVDAEANPFGYFYVIILNAFRNTLTSLHKRQDAQEEYKDLEYTRYFRDHPECYIAPNKEEDECWDE